MLYALLLAILIPIAQAENFFERVKHGAQRVVRGFNSSDDELSRSQPALKELTEGPAADAARALGIRIYYSKESFRLNGMRGDAISEEDATRFAYVLMNEFRLYPQACLRQVRFDRLLITSNLNARNEWMTATQDYAKRMMVYSAQLIWPSTNYPNPNVFALNVIHHEFFHYWDYRDDGTYSRDSAWSQLNRRGFRYAHNVNGGIRVYREASRRAARNEMPPTFDPSQAATMNYNDLPQQFWVARPELVGFLDRYSTAAIAEDKAEVFGGLMVRPTEFLDRAQQDQILARKAELLKSSMRQTCSAIGGNFWPSESDVRERLAIADRIARRETISDAIPLPEGTTTPPVETNPPQEPTAPEQPVPEQEPTDKPTDEPAQEQLPPVAEQEPEQAPEQLPPPAEQNTEEPAAPEEEPQAPEESQPPVAAPQQPDDQGGEQLPPNATQDPNRKQSFGDHMRGLGKGFLNWVRHLFKRE